MDIELRGPAELARVPDLVRSIRQRIGVSEGSILVDRVGAALAEAANNVVLHAARAGAPQDIGIALRIDANRLVLTITDRGRPAPEGLFDAVPRMLDFDPSDLENVPERGMGLVIIANTVDALHYDRVGGENRLRLEFHRNSAPLDLAVSSVGQRSLGHILGQMGGVAWRLSADERRMAFGPGDRDRFGLPAEMDLGPLIARHFDHDRAMFAGFAAGLLTGVQHPDCPDGLTLRLRGHDDVIKSVAWYADAPGGEEAIRAGFLLDLSELQRTKELLDRSEAYGRVGLWSYDLLEGSIEWSASLYSLYGRSLHDGAPDFDDLMALVHPDDREMLQGAVERAFAHALPGGSAHFQTSHRLSLPEREGVFVDIVGQIEFDGRSRPIRMSGISRERVFSPSETLGRTEALEGLNADLSWLSPDTASKAVAGDAWCAHGMDGRYTWTRVRRLSSGTATLSVKDVSPPRHDDLPLRMAEAKELLLSIVKLGALGDRINDPALLEPLVGERRRLASVRLQADRRVEHILGFPRESTTVERVIRLATFLDLLRELTAPFLEDQGVTINLHRAADLPEKLQCAPSTVMTCVLETVLGLVERGARDIHLRADVSKDSEVSGSEGVCLTLSGRRFGPISRPNSSGLWDRARILAGFCRSGLKTDTDGHEIRLYLPSPPLTAELAEFERLYRLGRDVQREVPVLLAANSALGGAFLAAMLRRIGADVDAVTGVEQAEICLLNRRYRLILIAIPETDPGWRQMIVSARDLAEGVPVVASRFAMPPSNRSSGPEPDAWVHSMLALHRIEPFLTEDPSGSGDPIAEVLPDTDLVDRTVLARVRDGVGDEGFDLLMQEVRNDLLKRERELDARIAEGDAPGVAAVAHSLAGIGGNFGLVSLSVVSRAVVQRHRAGTGLSVEDEGAGLMRVVTDTRVAIEQTSKGADPSGMEKQ